MYLRYAVDSQQPSILIVASGMPTAQMIGLPSLGKLDDMFDQHTMQFHCQRDQFASLQKHSHNDGVSLPFTVMSATVSDVAVS